MTADYPDAEAQRLQALHDYDVLDTGPEEAFDRITRLAKLIMDTPVARIPLSTGIASGLSHA